MKDQAGCLKPTLTIVVIVLIAVGARFHWANVIPVRNFPPPVPTPSPNGFNLCLKAYSALKPPRKPIDPVDDSQLLPPGEARVRYSLARRQAWMKQNAAAFALFKTALAAESRAPSTRGLTPVLMPYSQLRELARQKIAQSNTLEMEGQWRQAAEARLDIVEMGGDIQRGGDLLASLVGIACEAIGLNDFGPIVPHLSAPECRQLNARLLKLDAARPTFASVLQEDKIVSDLELINAWRVHDNASPFRTDSTRGTDFRSLFVSRRAMLDAKDKAIDAAIAAADKPVLQAKLKIAPTPYSDFVMTQDMAERQLFNAARGVARSQMEELHLALRAYRLEKGAYPATLRQLVPIYLPAVPIDPFGSGGPWGYKKIGASYLAWSIGPDGKDNGGKSFAERNGSTRYYLSHDSIGDYVATP